VTPATKDDTNMRVRDFEVRNRLRVHSAAQNIWVLMIIYSGGSERSADSEGLMSQGTPTFLCSRSLLKNAVL
jgi:hypothetical protein